MRTSIFIVVLLSIFSCKDRDPVTPIRLSDRQIVLNSLGNSVLTSGFVDLQTSFNALRGQVKSFNEDSTSVQKLLLLRNQWVRTAAQWKTVSLFSFGPVNQDFITSNIISPINSQAIEELLNQEQYPIDTTVVKSLSSNKRGLGAVEYLIFGKEPTNYAKTIDTFTRQSQKTAYLKALCDVMQKQVDFVLLTWSRGGQGYVETFIANDGDGANSSLALLYGAIHFQISSVRERLVTAMTLTNKDDFRPDLIDAPYSNESLQMLKAEVSGIQAVFTGQPISSADARGFNWLLDKANAKKGEDLLSMIVMRQFDVIYRQIDTIQPSLARAVLTNPTLVAQLLTEIDKLKSLIDSDVKTNLYLRD